MFLCENTLLEIVSLDRWINRRYCDCLKAGRECGPLCSCVDCFNHADRIERKMAIQFLKRRNPHAFLRLTGNVRLLSYCDGRSNRNLVAATVNGVSVVRSIVLAMYRESLVALTATV